MIESNERSPLWKFAIGGSLVGGLGYSLYTQRNRFSQALNLGRVGMPSATSTLTNQVGGFKTNRVVDSILPGFGELNTYFESTIGSKMNIVGAISSSVGDSRAKSDIANTVYRAILAGGRATESEAYQHMKKVLNAGSAVDAYSIARQSIRQTGGNARLFIKTIDSIANGGIYNPIRLHQFAQAASSTGGFIGSNIARTTSPIAPYLLSRATEIQKRLASSTTGTNLLSQNFKYYNIKEQVGGRIIETPLMVSKIAGQQVVIPLEDTGFTYGGENLATRYITRKAYGQEPGFKSYRQFYAESLESALSSAKSEQQIGETIARLNQRAFQQLREDMSGATSAAIYTMPEPLLTSGGRAKARLTYLQAINEQGNVSPEDLEKIMTETAGGGRQLYPFGGPTPVSKGTLSRRDIRRGLYGELGSWFGVEQRPEQFIRSEWGATQAAKDNAREFGGTFGKYFNRLEPKLIGPEYRKLLYGGADISSAQAYSAPQLMAFYAKTNDIGYEAKALRDVLSLEEGYISESAKKMVEYERVKALDISLAEGLQTNEQILSALKGKRVGELASINISSQSAIRGAAETRMAESFIGMEHGTGKELFTTLSDRMESEAIAAEIIDENVARIYMRETHRMTPGESWKFFGQDVKYMASIANDKKISDLLSMAEANDLKGVEAVFAGKVLSRNKYALLNQQIEALGFFASKKIDANKLSLRKRLAMQEFLANPINALGINDILKSGQLNADVQIQKNMFSLAKMAGFTPREMQLTFGLMSKEEIQKVFKGTNIEQAIYESPGVIGLSKLRLGDLAREGGVGGRGSFEPSGFRLLSMKGPEGQRFATELASRIANKGEMTAVDRLTASVLGLEDPVLSISDKAKQALFGYETELLKNIKPDELIRETGRYVDIGTKLDAFGGSKKIYIPGTLEAPNLLNPIIAKGERIDTPFVRAMRSFHRKLLDQNTSSAILEESAVGLQKAAFEASSSQAVASGKVIGTQILTGTSKEITGDAFQISKSAGERMFSDLLESTTTEQQKNFLLEQRERFLAGDTLAGAMWRHPTTGPESLQFIKYKIDSDLADGMVNAPKLFGKIQFGNSDPRSVDISQMVGFKGDFDKDQFVISAISDRETAKRISKQVGNNIDSKYAQYLFNHYGMKQAIDERKIQENIVNLSRAENLIQGMKKHTLAKATTGRVNLALQQLKLGLQTSAPEKYRPMAELFWHLEEAAIGGKHGLTGDKKLLSSPLYKSITYAVEQQDENVMQNVIKTLMGEQARDIEGSILSETGEELFKGTIKYDPARWATDTIDAVKVAGPQIDVAIKAARAGHKGNVSASLSDMIRMFNQRKTSLDVAQTLMASQAYPKQGLLEAGEKVARGSARIGRGLLSTIKGSKKAVIAGAAAAGLISLAMPSISGTLSTPEMSMSNTNKRSMTPDDLGPPSGPGLEPLPPRIMVSPKIYDVGSPKRANYANINTRIADSNNSDLIRNIHSLSGSTKVHMTDDRSVLNPQMLANKIDERL